MKRMDFFCSSPASTAICSSVDHRSMVRRGHRPIDRQNSKPYAPCSSQLPVIPRPYHEKNRKSSVKPSDVRRKSSADTHDLNSPPGSSRYLLSDRPFIDWLSESDRVSALVPAQPAKPKHVSSNDSPALKSSSSARSSSDQVVVLRVSIHCKGCEGKVRKHISKMEGVTSFSIDLATKKVTVIGDVTPSSVLASVSRVKNAQLWPSTTSSSSPSSPVVKMSH
ncbi:protein SODIUM POTASSIUM ROOT DEFECTIVE 3 [Herrania umbratica]|uniref:Protein SODIUM POTASSIUM ROOT DEFECTIVE 3 n=1 Tax=Herrania umbratica TaxID=108875 RepID=A0A6J0ZW34_9ROSI|nr:protein SODIUM POTASSIUM ROOT DEFECTIVE 3 [Herrania umbratica]